MVKDLDVWVEKYDRNARNAGPSYEAGIKAVSVDPTAEAVKARATFEAKMTDPKTFEKWEAGLNRWDADSWKKRTLAKGVKRYPDGIREGIEEYKKFAEEFKPHLEAGQAKVKEMSNVTLEDSIARSAAMIRHNAEFKRRR